MIVKVIRSLVSLIFLCGKKFTGSHLRFSWMTLVSPLSFIQTKEKNGRIFFGKKCEVRSNVEISANNAEVVFGSNCFVNRNCVISARKGISLGNDVTIGPGTCIYDHDHDGKGGFCMDSIIIGDDAWIGANCTILRGVVIANGVTVAAGSVVSKSILQKNVLFVQKRNPSILEKM